MIRRWDRPGREKKSSVPVGFENREVDDLDTATVENDLVMREQQPEGTAGRKEKAKRWSEVRSSSKRISSGFQQRNR